MYSVAALWQFYLIFISQHKLQTKNILMASENWHNSIMAFNMVFWSKTKGSSVFHGWGSPYAWCLSLWKQYPTVNSLIVLVLDHRPWDKPESPACFSCQNLQGKAATIQEQSHFRLQSAREKRGESQSTFFPRKPSATHAWRKRRWSKERVPLRGRHRADRCAWAGSSTSGPLL